VRAKPLGRLPLMAAIDTVASVVGRRCARRSSAAADSDKPSSSAH
jgi:hypothetical protein